MRLLPTTADSSFAVFDFFVMLAIVLLPAVAILVIWAVFFKNKRRRKRRRRHRESPEAVPQLSRNGATHSIRKMEDLTDQPKS